MREQPSPPPPAQPARARSERHEREASATLIMGGHALSEGTVLYAILCYNSEEMVTSWTKEQDDAVMARLSVVHERIQGAGKLGPSLRLHPTTRAVTLRKHKEPHTVTDGPYAETKEQILGFYVVDVADQDEALRIARELAQANPGGGYELRPISLYLPGALPPSSAQP